MKAAGLLSLVLLLPLCLGDYVPGQPGGPWTLQEMLVAKAKLRHLYRWQHAPKAVRLAFHDCLKYADGTGGCDGCLNWEGVDIVHNTTRYAKNLPNVDTTDNNGLGDVVRTLERVYREPNFPYGQPKLGQSLFASGKSRADLWSFAAIVGVEYGMEMNNIACNDMFDERIFGDSCIHDNGTECQIKPERPFMFQYGRADCTDHDPTDTYKTSKPEHHPNPVANGRSTVEFFRDDFRFNGRETVAIFGAHTFGQPHITTSLFPYSWTSRALNLFNNDYYKVITGQPRWFIDDPQCNKVGDAFGNKPQTRWLAHTRKMTHRGGPIFWIHQNHVCPSLHSVEFTLSLSEQQCVDEAGPGMTCRADPTAESSSPRTANQTDGDLNNGCERFRLIRGRDEIALNCEMGLYREFEVTNGVIHGCPGLDNFNASMASDKQASVWSSFPGVKGRQEPLCPRQRLAEPAGSTPLHEIMDEYANNQTAWINDFIPTMEKMMRNGYTNLAEAPDFHSNVHCPLTPLRNYDPILCYQESPESDEPSFMVASRFDQLAGKVLTFNMTTGAFEFAAQTWNLSQTQKWVMSESGTQILNVFSRTPYSIQGNVDWAIEKIDEDFIVENPLTGEVVDCYPARLGQPCITWKRHGAPNQRFYMITLSDV